LSLKKKDMPFSFFMHFTLVIVFLVQQRQQSNQARECAATAEQVAATASHSSFCF
jgi:hypothetical protein